MRLAVKTGAWIPTPNEWRMGFEILQQCEPLEEKRILKLKIEEDRKRSLVGRLLLRYACALQTDVKYSDLNFVRTKENKPVCLDLISGQVNISHHGDWVVLVSDPNRSIGVDVMKYEEPRRGRETFFHTMKSQFTSKEWEDIGSSLQMFYRFWALKESYIKGIGIGLGFNLQRASFKISEGENQAHVEIDGKVENDWQFSISELDEMHCVAIAFGPSSLSESIEIDTKFATLTASELLAKFN